jgi:hypothetical protein
MHTAPRDKDKDTDGEDTVGSVRTRSGKMNTAVVPVLGITGQQVFGEVNVILGKDSFWSPALL